MSNLFLGVCCFLRKDVGRHLFAIVKDREGLKKTTESLLSTMSQCILEITRLLLCFCGEFGGFFGKEF
jgi:hypothetical protein